MPQADPDGLLDRNSQSKESKGQVVAIDNAVLLSAIRANLQKLKVLLDLYQKMRTTTCYGCARLHKGTSLCDT